MSPLEGDHGEDHHAEGDGGGGGAASGPDWVVLSETAGAASNTESHHRCTNIDPQVHAPLLQAVLRAGLYCLPHKLGGGLLSGVLMGHVASAADEHCNAPICDNQHSMLIIRMHSTTQTLLAQRPMGRHGQCKLALPRHNIIVPSF